MNQSLPADGWGVPSLTRQQQGGKMLCSAVGLCLGLLSSCTSASASLWFPFQDPLSQVLCKKTSLAPSFFLSPLCLLTCCLCLSPQAGVSPLCPRSAHSVTLGTRAQAKSSRRPLNKAGSFCGNHLRADRRDQEDLRDDLTKGGRVVAMANWGGHRSWKNSPCSCLDLCTSW